MRKKYRELYYRVLSAFLALCMVMTFTGVGTMHVHAENEIEEISQIDTVTDLEEEAEKPKEEEEEPENPKEEEEEPENPKEEEEEPENPKEEEEENPKEEEEENPKEEEEENPKEEEEENPKEEEEEENPKEEEENPEEEASNNADDKTPRIMLLNDNMAADVATDLAAISDGATLSSGVYYLSESKTFGSASTMNNGLKIGSGATVYIYIPNGITLTAIGGGTNSARTTGGYAGILLPDDAKLIVLGEGSLVATGGRAGNGASGSSGSSGTLSVESYYYGGSGGKGGAGGGGAGAGIGTNGGTGGAGGSSTGSGTKKYNGDENYSGTSGNSGSQGGTASACGTLYVQNTIMLTATGGSAGSAGSGGSAGSCSYKNSKWDDKQYHVAGGGGGGGGGGAGYSANGIGTGGAAGGGGGSGGRGGIDYSNTSYGSPGTNATCNGAGGYGGYGYSNGSNGSGTRDSGTYSDKWDQTGGTGGSRGSAGSGSVAKSALTSGWTNKIYSVTFKGTNSETVFQTDYVYGTQSTITVPEYTPEAGECFLGWEVSVYGAAVTSGAELTSTSMYTDTTVYQPGKNITIEAGVSGSIELVPIIGTMSGTSVQTEVLTISASEINREVTYYTYTVETTLDGKVTDMGNLTLEDSEGKTYIISYENGAYTYITSENETYTILQNGKSLGATVTAGETAVIPYKTLTIETKLNGSTSAVPGDVTISGTDAPGISTERNSGIYTAVDLASNTNEYSIWVGGVDTGEKISLGEEVKLDYYSTTVNIGGNTAAESVALRENNGDRVYILAETSSNQFVLTEPEVEGTYTLYVNGFKTEYTTVNLSQENSFEVNLFTTVITTTLNGDLVDMDSVIVGEQQAIRESKGRYTTFSVITGETPTETVTISGRDVGSVTIGTEREVSYYSVEYTHGSTEANILPVDNMVYLEGDEVTILSSVTPKDNVYTFDGWKVSGNVKQPGETFDMPAARVEIPANWKETVYNISYELQEPTAINHSSNPGNYTISSTFTLKEPTLDGYIFEGWTYGEITAPTKEVRIEKGTTGELTFAANWILKTYEISVDRTDVDFGSRISGYSGESMQERISVTSIGNQDITIKTLECDDDNFEIIVSGMDTSLAGNGGYTEFTVQPKDGLADGTYTGTITIATVEGNTETIDVQFEVGKDGTPPEASITVGEKTWDDIVFEPESETESITLFNTEQSITITATDTEKGVKEIKYYIATQPLMWSDMEEDWLGTDGTLLKDWEVYDDAYKPVISEEGIYYIYAKATDKENPANITDISTDMILIDKTAPIAEFVNETEQLTDNGIYLGKKQVKVTDERLASVTLNDVHCENIEEGCLILNLYANENVAQKIVATDEAGNVTTIYLTINPRQYTVSYDLNGGIGTITSGTAKENVSYTVSDADGITAPVGKEFAYWAVGSIDSTITVEAGKEHMFNEDTTLYAIWKYIPYEITYHMNGGTNALTNPATYTMDMEDITLAEPDREDYIFAGWTWESGKGVGSNAQDTPIKEVVIPKGSIGNKVFTANWIRKDYTITSDKGTSGVVFDSKLEYVYVADSITVTIKNAGNWTVNLKAPTSGANNSAFVLGGYSNAIIEPGETATFIISTKEKLDVGTYTETITIETIEGTSVDIPVSFTVTGDYNAPTGSIIIKDNKWTEFLNTITFGLFFNKTQDVTIEAEDLVDGIDANTGVGKVYYYLAETKLDKSDLDSLLTDSWEEYEKKFSIVPDSKLVVYAKIVDNAENITYVSSDGLVFDATTPVILGIEDGKTYCESQTITINEDNLERVTVNGSEVTLTDKSYELIGTGTEYTVLATDKAGNATSITGTVFNSHDMGEATCTENSKCQREGCNHTEGKALGHDWSGEWRVTKEATETEEGKKETLCVRGCGQKKVVIIPVTGTTEDNGNLEKSVEIKSDSPIDEATLDNSIDELLEGNNIFSDGERTQIENGTDAKVWIEISNTDEDTIASTDKIKVEQKAAQMIGGNPIITYFDADLFMQIGNGAKREITEPGQAIKITIIIPDEILNANKNVSREYKIIRLHEGQVEVIDGTFDSKTSEFSFESDKFSTYAIIYKDVPKVNDDGKNDKPDDGGNDKPDDGESDKPDDGGNDKPDDGGNDKPDDGESDKPDDGSNESVPNGEEQKDIPEAEVVDSVPTEEEEQLSDAVEEIQDIVPGVQPGPYVQIPQGQDGASDESQQFTIKIPDELVKEGRTYYLVTVDENGNIVVRQSDGIKDGVLTFTGNPNSSYQIVYEDGAAYLADMLNENGYLVDENGEIITVDTNHCFWHYIILVLALIGIALSIFFRDKRKNQLFTVGIVTIIMLILIIAGWCIWDILFAILAEVIMVALIIGSKNKQEDDELEYE